MRLLKFLACMQAGWTEYDNGTPVMIYPTEVSDTAVDSMLYVRTSPLVLCGEYESVATQVSRFCLPYGKSTIGKHQCFP